MAYIVNQSGSESFPVRPAPMRRALGHHSVRRWAVCVAALLTVNACSASDSVTSTSVSGAAADIDEAPLGFTPASLDWAGCGGRLQCTSLDVPLDYDDPTGPMISLALAMFPARGPEPRIGALITNPGGPGGSGVSFLDGGGPFNDEINRRFDVVSWDPRGVGGTEPLACGTELAELFLSVDLAPEDAAGRATLERRARDDAAACTEANRAVLEHVGTDDAVRDVEAIRLALGGEPITYVGFSYGTLIGLRYAERFPSGLRGMALDGIIDPEHTLGDQMATTAMAIDRSLAEVLAACDAGCPIDGDPLTAYRQLVEQARSEPLRTDDGEQVAANAVVLAGIAVTYDVGLRDLFYAAISEGQRGRGNVVQQLAEGFVGQFDLASTVAVSCLDLPHLGSVADVEDLATTAANGAAVVPGLVSGYIRAFTLPCIDWPVEPPSALLPVTAGGSPPILVIGNTGDSATPYESARRVAGTLEHGRLLTYHGAAHTTYGKDDCADAYIDAYLLELSLPPSGNDCPA